MSAIPEESRRILAERAPGLAARIAAAPVPEGYTLGRAASGAPILVAGGMPLDHAADPEAEAARWARDAAGRLEALGARRAVVIGLGLGYHVEALAARFAGAIVVVEPDLAVWRLALGARDLAPLLARVEIVADDAEPPAPPSDPALVLAHAPALLVAGGAHRRALERWQASARRLRVLVVSPLAGGSWPIAGYAARALAEIGHDVRLLDLAPFHDALGRLEIFGARRARRAELEARLCDTLGAGVAAAVEATEPDLVLALAQAPLGPAALDAIAARGALRALWFVEDFRLFDYWREVAAHYDYVLTIQEGECLEAIGAVTGAHVRYLPCGLDPAVHRPLDLDPVERAAYGSELSFVGAGYHNRRVAFRRFLDTDFRIWGSDWGGADELARVIQRGGARVSTADAVRVFNASAVSLNLHSSTYHDGVDPRGDFVNPRTFELAGAGAFQVVDRRSLLPPLFTPGEEVAVAASVEEMRALALHYLARPDERAAMAARARRRALAEHTYVHRMRALLGLVLAAAHERLLGRRRVPTIGDAARGGDGGLERFLARLEPAAPLGLETLAAGIAEGAGPLDEPEAIVLFLRQFEELYLREYRA